MTESNRVIPAIQIPAGMTREQAHALGELAREAHRQIQAASVKRAIAQHEASKAPESPANTALRDAIRQELPNAEATVRTIVDKQSPIDEGQWEFRLSGGVLEVIAWNDEKTEAQSIRLVRRGTQIHLMHSQNPEGEDE